MKRIVTIVRCLSCGYEWRAPYFVAEEDREVKTCGQCVRMVTREIGRLFGVQV